MISNVRLLNKQLLTEVITEAEKNDSENLVIYKNWKVGTFHRQNSDASFENNGTKKGRNLMSGTTHS